jgi:hypothetical protein
MVVMERRTEMPAVVTNQIGAPITDQPQFRWIVRRNGGRIWGWVTADSEAAARQGLREESVKRGIKLTLGERAPKLRLVP